MYFADRVRTLTQLVSLRRWFRFSARNTSPNVDDRISRVHYISEMCGRGPVRGPASASLLSVRGRTRPYVQLRTRARTGLTEFANCTYAMNANKESSFSNFRVSSVSFNLAQNVSSVSAVTCFLYWWHQLVMWHGPIEYFLGYIFYRIYSRSMWCDVALCSGSISIDAPWLYEYNTTHCLPQPVSFWCYSQSAKWKPVVLVIMC